MSDRFSRHKPNASDPGLGSRSDSAVKVNIAVSDYGKNFVKLLYVRKGQAVHHMKEIEVNTALTLNNHGDYIHADNSDIIATDTQKNTVYVLAKQHGVTSVEEFAMVLSRHFLHKYSHVIATKISIEEYPWKRIKVNGTPHVHAFEFSANCKRVCEVTQKRYEKPIVMAGIRELRVLKTTKSAFTNFVSDEYRTLADTDDRIMSTIVTANWWYNTAEGFSFDKSWETVRDIILANFAGPPDTGVFSASVQHTLYLMGRQTIARLPQVDSIDITLPNKHYFDVDFTRFSRLDFTGTQNNEVYQAVDKPSGNIHATVKRSVTSKL